MKKMKDLSYHYGLKMRIYPSTQQKQLIKLNSDIARTVYNKLIAIDQELYQLNRVKLPLDVVTNRIDELKKRKNPKNLSNHFKYMDNKLLDRQVISTAKQTYQNAWNMYKKVHTAGIPKFHKKGYVEKYQTSAHYGKKAEMNVFDATGVKFLDMQHIQLPKLGSDTPFVAKKRTTDSQVGVDLNTENFLTSSNGAQIANPRYYRTIKGKLAKAQRKLSRRQLRAKKDGRNLRNAKNYQKQRLVVAKLQARVRRQRNNFLHKVSTALINNHDLVVAENLRGKNMLKNHALAMSISDVGWRTFLQMMEYKANLYGRTFITVDPKNTTQICSDCGFIMGKDGSSKLTLADRKWTCPNCHKHHIRDWNAAKNILAKGLAKIA